MANDFFELKPLEELVAIHDADRKPVKKGDRKEGIYPYYGASGITDYVDDFIFDGDYVLLSEDGDNLRTRNTPIAFMARGKFWVNNHAHILKGKNGNNTDFICYALQVADVNSYISGSTRPKITQRDMKNIPVYCPPLAEQKAIAHTLGTLDDKIELNRQMNETLESMAQALFKSWFVDFDPVIDNALAAGNAIPDELLERAEQRKGIEKKENAEIQDLFPDEFEFTEEMGWIPKGWSISSLDDLTTELRRGISPKYTEVDGVRVVNQRCIRNHSIDYSICRLNDAIIRKVEGRYLEVGDVLVNSTGVGTLGRMAQVSYLDKPTVVDSHVTVVRPNTELVKPYTFGRLMLSIEPLVESMGLGSTGQTELSRVHLGELIVCIPPIELQELVEKSFLSYSDKSAFNVQKNITLAKLRDTLLPKLMSGELRLQGIPND